MEGVVPKRIGGPATKGVQERLQKLITESLKPGDQLPSEPELAATYGVSRSSVRETLKVLEQDGLVYSVHGRGRFVSPMGAVSVDRPITRYESTTSMLQSLGFPVTTVVLEVKEAVASDRAAEMLDIPPSSPVIELIRLRVTDEQPLVLSCNTIVRDWSIPVTEALAAYGQELTASAARITSVNMPSELAERFNVGGLDPWLLVEETSFTREGARVLYSLDYHRGDLIGFNVLRRS
jgi:GntR family transcriptional regulator